MQSNRLFEILYILLDKKKTTARELAERFEVSTRTIYRDIDALSLSGIPVYMEKGKGGGIALMQEFVLQKSLLSDEEQNRILIGLQSLRATQYPETEKILSKITGLFQQKSPDWIEVDFSGWGEPGKDKFTLLKEAVLNKNTLSFEYFASNGKKTKRTVEPLRLLYKGKAWYVQGYCKERQDYRVFKVSRMKSLKITGIHFERSVDELPQGEKQSNVGSWVEILLEIDEAMAYRVYDEFEEENIQRTKDGFIVRAFFPEDEWVYGYILSFGPYARVKEPARLKTIIYDYFKKAIDKYDNMT